MAPSRSPLRALNCTDLFSLAIPHYLTAEYPDGFFTY